MKSSPVSAAFVNLFLTQYTSTARTGPTANFLFALLTPERMHPVVRNRALPGFFPSAGWSERAVNRSL
jgi:hypothetical protein